MPNFSGKWSQNQILYNDLGFYKAPGAPTSVSATAGDTQSVVSFTAPTYAGLPATITGYKVTASTGGSIVATVTGSASPITVTGLTNFTTYTMDVYAQNAAGYGDAGTTTATPSAPSQTQYDSPGTYTFVAPASLNPATVSAVCVGAGGRGNGGSGGGGAELRYKNSISVTAGNSYTIVVGATNTTSGGYGGRSTFDSGGVYMCRANGGQNSVSGSSTQAGGSGGVGDGGGNGGTGSTASGTYGSAGGAGGYAGTGGNGRNANSGTAYLPAANSGGACGGANANSYFEGGGGGGVGLLGLGTTGTSPGDAGSGGTNGDNQGPGGYFGGGAGGHSGNAFTPGYGAVRIIYSFSGATRAFPSTNTGDL